MSKFENLLKRKVFISSYLIMVIIIPKRLEQKLWHDSPELDVISNCFVVCELYISQQYHQ